jgi:dihydroflavonol-4-reductase
MDSKRKAQEYLLEQYQRVGLPVIIINPTYMIGEYDTKPGSGQMILSVVKRQVPGFAEGGKCVVYVGDVARAAVNALKMGKIGECYITGGQNLSYQEFFALITSAAGMRDLTFKIPRQLAIFSGFCLEQFAKVSGKAPRLTAVMARMSSDGHYYTSSKALRELALPQTAPEVAIRNAVEYFRKIGYL